MSEIKKTTTKADALVMQLAPKDIGLSEDQRKTVAPESFSLAVRTLLQNWRQGTVACKGRSDVKHTGKKPWKQKGTGRARAGDSGSPLWRGGGVTFGPQQRTRTLKMTKKMKKNVAAALLWNAFDNKTITALNWSLEGDAPKTKHAFEALVKAGVNVKKQHINVFLAPHDLITAASFANIPSVRVVFYDAANAYDLADSAAWIVLKKDLESFKEMVARWI